MTPERWEQIDQIFEQALEIEPAARSAYLDEACRNDGDLRREVESMLSHDLEESLVSDSVEEATRLLSPSAATPEFIGRYRIIKILGAGGMGRVFLAQDEQLNRPVAVKLLSEYGTVAQDRLKRFRREALAASALNHPNILTIYEIGEDAGHNFIATEFVDGQTLQELIRRGPIATERAIEIGSQIASALSAAHNAGIVHRDIKPANVMVRADDLVKVLDFGVAKYTEADALSGHSEIETASGTVIGTAAYMSPEQARGLPLDPRTDLWSAGTILYELISGVRPFQGQTPLDTMAAVIEKPAAPFSVYALKVPSALEGIVFKALQKDRDQRYQTASEMLADLKQVAKALAAGEDRSLEAPTAPLRTRQEVTSIAVLPFVNMSADPENEYFCDGLSEELLNALTRVENLKVAARTSAFSFKGKNATASGIARTLNVTSILEGSVRKSGNKLRIGVQLVNAADGYQLWSQRYDREVQDIFDVQDEIALSVVDALKVTLLKSEKAAVLNRYTENVEAYQLYLKGRFYWWKSTPEDFHKSREFFQRAVEADPNYALGYCGLSSYYGLGSAFGFVPPEVGWPLAIEANKKAMQLDDSLAEVHNDLAGISMVYYRDSAATEREARRAIELNPKFQEIHYLFSDYLLNRGKFDQAIGEARAAVELDPLSVRVNNHLGHAYFMARRYDEAISQFRQALELDEKNPLVHEGLAGVLEQATIFSEAIAHYRKALELTGEADAGELVQRVFSEKGFVAAMHALAEKELEGLKAASSTGQYIPAIKFVRAYVRLGEIDQAFSWLEKACAERNVFALSIHVDPFYEPLRKDARFAEVLRQFELTGSARGPTLEAAAATENTHAESSRLLERSENVPRPSSHTTPYASRINRMTLALTLVLLAVLAGVGWFIYRGIANRRSPQFESIAVLPFKNESGNNELDYLSDGMTESLINSLSQLPNLTVKARTSVFRYAGKEIDPQRVASELAVQAILTGRVIQRGDELTLYLSLVNATTGNQIWGDRYDRKRADLVSLQSEIARDVSQKLRVRLSGADQQKLAKNYTENVEAYQLYLKGQYQVYKLLPSETQKAISYFQQAIDIDPGYALAYVGLANAYRALGLSGEMPSTEVFPKAKAAAQKAVELDDDLAEAHAILGFTIFWYDWDWNAAEAQCKRALELNPNAAEAHFAYAHLLSNLGRHAEALAEIKRAKELDPLHPVMNASEGLYLNSAGRPDEALAKLQKTLELNPNFWFTHMWIASSYIDKGMFSEGVVEAQKAKALTSISQPTAFEGYALAKLGRRAEAQARVQELLTLSTQRYVSPYSVALICDGLGNRDKTIEWLERAYKERDVHLVFLKVEPKWNNLRDDPRFQELLRRVGF